MVGHHHFVRLEHRLQRRRIQCHRFAVADFGAAGHGVQQGAGAAALADVEGLGRLPEPAVHADRPLEHHLQVREQAHLELVAAELRARLVEHVDGLVQRLRGLRFVAQRGLALADAVQRPGAVEAFIAVDRRIGQLLVQHQRLGRLVLGQQQAASRALQLRLLRGIAGLRQRVQRAARAGEVAGQDQRIGQRGVHQRAEAGRALGARLVVQRDRLGEALLPRAHVAQHLAARAVHLGRVDPGVLQGEIGELLRALQLPRIAERDRQVPVRLAQQVRVPRLQRHVQRLARRPRALPELALLRQLHRLAAVRIPVQLHRFALVQRRAFRRQRQRRIGILQPANRRQRLPRFSLHVSRRDRSRRRGLRRKHGPRHQRRRRRHRTAQRRATRVDHGAGE